MFEFTRNFYFPENADVSTETGVDPAIFEGGEAIEPSADDTPSFAPGTVIIPEQTVETVIVHGGDFASCNLSCEVVIAPDVLTFTFEGNNYTLHAISKEGISLYGEFGDNGVVFDTIPFAVELSDGKGLWGLATPSVGTYTISAKIPEEKSSKVLSFPKGRTIVSELSRLNKAFGNISKKQTIIGQLSDIADAAEAGKIGGGLPPYTVSDDNKALTVEKEQSGTATVTVISTQQVTFAGEKVIGQLAEGTLNTQTLEDGDTVTVTVGEDSYTCEYVQQDNLITSSDVVIDSQGTIALFNGTAGTYTVSAYATTIVYKAKASWKAIGEYLPDVTESDHGSVPYVDDNGEWSINRLSFIVYIEPYGTAFKTKNTAKDIWKAYLDDSTVYFRKGGTFDSSLHFWRVCSLGRTVNGGTTTYYAITIDDNGNVVKWSATDSEYFTAQLS